jgi:predicted deacetylase
MPAQYLLRFDDLCPTTNWAVWNRVEALLDQYSIQPLVAVVPDNRDPLLQCAAPDPAFWQRVRAWQQRGWTIALHGYQHLYVTRHSGLVGRNRYSEFAGLPGAEQRRKLQAGLAIFQTEGVRADCWIAPAHSFDRTTVSLLLEAGINCISDGYALRPYRCQQGAFWVPQQIANFRHLPAGVWTFCLHPNGWTDSDIHSFEMFLAQYSPLITNLSRIEAQYSNRRASMADRGMAQLIRTARNLRSLLTSRQTNQEAAPCTSPM